MTEPLASDTHSPDHSRKLNLVRNIRPAWLGVVLIALVTFIFVTTQSTYSVYVYDSILLACMGAIALQVLQGTAGLVSVGTSAFLLIGAFGAVFALRSGFTFPFDLVLATLASGVAGLIVGLPALRLRALFLALTTLAAYYLAVFLGNLYQVHVPEFQATGFYIPTLFASRGLAGAGRDWAWLLFAFVALLILGASRVMRERSGRAMRMIREHEHIAPTFGVSVASYKLSIFVLSSMVIGLEGGLTAHFSGLVSTGSFSVALAFQYVAMIVIGGLDSIAGAVIGATIVVGLPVWVPSIVGPLIGSSQATADGPNISLIIYGVLVIVFVTSSKDGVVGLLNAIGRGVRRQAMRHGEE